MDVIIHDALRETVSENACWHAFVVQDSIHEKGLQRQQVQILHENQSLATNEN